MAKLNWSTGTTISEDGRDSMMANCVHLKLDGIPRRPWVAPPWVGFKLPGVDLAFEQLNDLIRSSIDRQQPCVAGTYPTQIVQDEWIPDDHLWAIDTTKIGDIINQPFEFTTSDWKQPDSLDALRYTYSFGLASQSPSSIVSSIVSNLTV